MLRFLCDLKVILFFNSVLAILSLLFLASGRTRFSSGKKSFKTAQCGLPFSFELCAKLP